MAKTTWMAAIALAGAMAGCDGGPVAPNPPGGTTPPPVRAVQVVAPSGQVPMGMLEFRAVLTGTSSSATVTWHSGGGIVCTGNPCSTMFSSIGSHTVVVDVVDGGWSGSATTSFTVVAPPTEYSWAEAAMPLLREVDKVVVTSSDSLPWTGKLSDALAAARVSIVVSGSGAQCLATSRTIRLGESSVVSAMVNMAGATLAHEASHCLIGPPSWARHTAGLSEDSTYGDGGAYSLEARYVRAYIERVGEGPFGEMRARMRSIALKIRAGHPAWMLDPTLILSANGK